MIIVSDTTPIISLLKADKLELLRELFEIVLVPQAVYMELVDNPIFTEEADKIKDCPYLKVEAVDNQAAVNILRNVTGLDAGESEAIVLSEEKKADLLLMDEQKGRQVAKQMGLNITGTMGILMEAFDEQIITRDGVLICIERLKESNRRISETLYNLVLGHIFSGK